MKNSNYSLLGLACTVLLLRDAYAPLPAHAAKVFNVKSYGAVGNGTTDDTSAILAATAAANADPGSTLLFPQGNYLVGGIFTANGIEVVGQRATITTSSTAGLEISGRNTTVHGLTFASKLSANAGTVGILVNQATGFVIGNNSFNGLTDGISVSQSSKGKINANNMQLSSLSIAGVLLSSSSDILAQQNVIGGSGGSTPSAFRPSNCNNVTIDSNRITNLAFGIFSNGTTSDRYTNNTLDQLGTNGIDLNSDTNVTLTGNRISFANTAAIKVSVVTSANINGNFMAAGQIGINLLSGSSSINIRGNEITSVFNAITGGFVVGVNITGNDLSGLNSVIKQVSDVNLVVEDNEISRCNNAGVVLTNCIGTTQIRNNVLEKCALAPVDPKAIIYVNCPIERSIVIDSNTYTGATKATYFIWCVQPSPPAQITGNRTNTGLPNRIGS